MCGKTKINILRMHKVLDEDTVKPEILPQIVCGKTWLCFRRRLGGSYFMRSLRVESLAVDSRLLLLFHDVALVGGERHPPQPLALAAASLHVFCVVAHAHVCGTIVLYSFWQEI